MSVGADTVLIREGEVTGALFVLVEGAVEVSREGTVIAVVDEPGALFGEMSVLLDGPATASVRCIRPSRLRRSDDPRGFLTVHPDVSYAVATSLARRLDTINGYLVDLRRQYAGQADNLGMVDAVLETLGHPHRRPADPGSEREPEAP